MACRCEIMRERRHLLERQGDESSGAAACLLSQMDGKACGNREAGRKMVAGWGGSFALPSSEIPTRDAHKFQGKAGTVQKIGRPTITGQLWLCAVVSPWRHSVIALWLGMQSCQADAGWCCHREQGSQLP